MALAQNLFLLYILGYASKILLLTFFTISSISAVTKKTSRPESHLPYMVVVIDTRLEWKLNCIQNVAYNIIYNITKSLFIDLRKL